MLGSIDSTAVVINPGAMAMFHYGLGPSKKIVPFGGAGFSVPIIISDHGDLSGVDNVKAGFNTSICL